MSKRMVDLLFTQGAMELDRRDNSVHPWSIDALRDGGPAGTGARLFDLAEILVVDNVTRYLYEVCEQEEWGGEDFPNCAPPFPTMWMESRAPARIRSGTTVRPWDGYAAWGVLIHATELPEGLQAAFHSPDGQTAMEEATRQQWQTVLRIFAHQGMTLPTSPPPSEAQGRAWFALLPEDCRAALQQYVVMKRASEGLVGLPTLETEVRWHYVIFPFVQLHAHDVIHGPLMYGVALVSATGQLVALPTSTGGTQYIQWSVMYGETIDPTMRTQFAGLGNAMLFPMWLALSFLHCKNVTLSREDPCHSRKPPKKGETCRRLHYHVLNIKPMQEVLRRDGQSHTTGLKQALHICRGHFKDYRQRGLFGKYQGLFWWDAHVRGKSDTGVVVKDYNVQVGIS